MRWVLLVCLLGSFLAGPIQAQDGLTETYLDEGKGITFKYPAGWIVTDTEDSVTLSNAPIEDTSVLAVEPDVIKISISGRASDEDSDLDMQAILGNLGGEDALLFLAGFDSGAMVMAYQLIASIATAFGGEVGQEPSTEVLNVEETTIGDRSAVMVEIALTGLTDSHLIVIVLEDYTIVNIGGDENALSAWRDTAMMIVETLRPMEQD